VFFFSRDSALVCRQKKEESLNQMKKNKDITNEKLWNLQALNDCSDPLPGEKTKFCSRCKATSYCSTEHQVLFSFVADFFCPLDLTAFPSSAISLEQSVEH
jgi:hypothetical protein